MQDTMQPDTVGELDAATLLGMADAHARAAEELREKALLMDLRDALVAAEVRLDEPVEATVQDPCGGSVIYLPKLLISVRLPKDTYSVPAGALDKNYAIVLRLVVAAIEGDEALAEARKIHARKIALDAAVEWVRDLSEPAVSVVIFSGQDTVFWRDAAGQDHDSFTSLGFEPENDIIVPL